MNVKMNPNLLPEVIEREGVHHSAIARETLAIDLFRRGFVTDSQLREALGIEQPEADALLERHQVVASASGQQTADATVEGASLDVRFRQLWDQLLRQNANTPEFSSRIELYTFLNRTLLGSGELAFDFLEFGVYKGDSMRAWCAQNRNPRSRFYGFDSFRGLPEDWKPGRLKGVFDRGGNAPETPDPRVRWVVGWFQQSLPEFLRSYQPAQTLVVHNDSDLYSSTLFCLTSLNALLRPGTIIIFDEFDDVFHEFRAFTDYFQSYLKTYKVLAHTKWFTQTAVMIL